MKTGEFLPQYAAQAVIDLEKQAKRLQAHPGAHYYHTAIKSVATLIRSAVHVVLPANGEIYRGNYRGGDRPTADELESFAGLPAPVTCFEYPWTIPKPDDDTGYAAPRRITIVSDGKQNSTVKPLPETIFCATIISVIYNEAFKCWQLMDVDIAVAQPLRVDTNDIGHWGYFGRVRNLNTGQDFAPNDPVARKAAGEYKPDMTAVIQCCHALRAGATFDERVESSASRKWKFDKRGVGGFTYHVLRLPAAVSRAGGVPTGTHDSPRFHVRRAHIRKLPTGVLTFVRQCFVGDREKGVVDKHYRMERACVQ